MSDWPPLAFIDVETTGLDPAVNRIAEIGVVTVDGDKIHEWTTFVAQANGQSRRPRSFDGMVEPGQASPPAFSDIAVELDKRLAGRLLIAHNARFDYAFLKAEFQRARIDFSANVLCTLMLSRRLYPQHARHDLDSLMKRHALDADTRHRALPDARLLWQFWQTTHREIPRAVIADTVAALLAGPVFPEELDAALINRLPDAPGIYLFHDREDRVIHVGDAHNLRLHLVDYFRLDRASVKSLALAQRITKITWRVTQGIVGARLQRIAVANALAPGARAKDERSFTWRFVPERYPVLELGPFVAGSLSATGECFGLFQTERRARNALLQIARKHYLCHALLGLPDAPESPCLACGDDERTMQRCGAAAQRLKQLVKSYRVLKPLRVAAWPYPGPIGIRERFDVHVFDEWCYLGSARNDNEIEETLQRRRREFDHAIFLFLSDTLPKLPPTRILRLFSTTPSGERSSADDDTCQLLAAEPMPDYEAFTEPRSSGR